MIGSTCSKTDVPKCQKFWLHVWTYPFLFSLHWYPWNSWSTANSPVELKGLIHLQVVGSSGDCTFGRAFTSACGCTCTCLLLAGLRWRLGTNWCPTPSWQLRCVASSSLNASTLLRTDDIAQEQVVLWDIEITWNQEAAVWYSHVLIQHCCDFISLNGGSKSSKQQRNQNSAKHRECRWCTYFCLGQMLATRQVA